MDNLASRKKKSLRQLIKAAGARLILNYYSKSSALHDEIDVFAKLLKLFECQLYFSLGPYCQNVQNFYLSILQIKDDAEPIKLNLPQFH